MNVEQQRQALIEYANNTPRSWVEGSIARGDELVACVDEQPIGIMAPKRNGAPGVRVVYIKTGEFATHVTFDTVTEAAWWVSKNVARIAEEMV